MNNRAVLGQVLVPRDVTALLEGAVSGVLGTLSMSVVMLAARWAGLVGQLPHRSRAARHAS